MLLQPLRQWLIRAGAGQQRRRDADSLMALDDRMLADIGLRRDEIAYATRYGRLPEWRKA